MNIACLYINRTEAYHTLIASLPSFKEHSVFCKYSVFCSMNNLCIFSPESDKGDGGSWEEEM